MKTSHSKQLSSTFRINLWWIYAAIYYAKRSQRNSFCRAANTIRQLNDSLEEYTSSITLHFTNPQQNREPSCTLCSEGVHQPASHFYNEYVIWWVSFRPHESARCSPNWKILIYLKGIGGSHVNEMQQNPRLSRLEWLERSSTPVSISMDIIRHSSELYRLFFTVCFPYPTMPSEPGYGNGSKKTAQRRTIAFERWYPRD